MSAVQANPQHVAAVRAIAVAFLETIKEAGPLGAPGGIMYAAVLDKMSLDQFNQFMSGLQRTGLIEKRGECYHYVGGK